MNLNSRDYGVLRRSVVLRALPDHVVDMLLAGGAPQALQKGQLLFQRGDRADAFFIVVEGWIKLFRQNTDGDETVVHVVKAGESFAEAAMFTGGVYPVSAEAATPARVESIAAHAMRQAIREDPDVAFAMFGAMSRHLHHLVDQIEQLKRANGPQRVAEFLIELCPPDQAEALLNLPFEKVLIAARLGMTPESLSRALAKLKPLGVTSNGPEVTVRDCRALREFVSAERREPVVE